MSAMSCLLKNLFSKKSAIALLALLSLYFRLVTSFIVRHQLDSCFQLRTTSSPSRATHWGLHLSKLLPEPENSQFGRQDYWNEFYGKESNFSWYAGWEDLKPFVEEFVDPLTDRILIPGVGNDAMLVDMYDDGYTNIAAMDYAAEGIERCREMMDGSRLSAGQDQAHKEQVELVVADARDLQGVFDKDSFDVVLEKGTLDAIFLSGGQNKTLARENLDRSISELGRCVKPGGIWMSIAGVVDDQIQASFDLRPEWESLVRQDDLYVTSEGYTSNNIDGSLLVWRKKC